jgi:tetratricopeptide (TPR) repeat protein
LFSAASMTLGHVYLSIGEYDRGITHLRESLEIAPGFSYARGHLGQAYLQLGRYDDALRELAQAVVTGAASDMAQLAYGYAVAGRRKEALAIVDKLLNDKDGYPPRFHLAMAYVGLGEVDEAFRWLERAAEDRDPHVLGLNIVVAFRPLRNDPRFEAILERIGVRPAS